MDRWTCLAGLLLSLGSDACNPPTPTRPVETPREQNVATHVANPAVEFDVGPPGSPRALLIALHGRGDRPDRFADLFRGLTARARVRVLRAPYVLGDGFSWFGTGGQTWNDEFLRAVAIVRTELQNSISPLICGKPVLTGFSQGAMLAYAIAAIAPNEASVIFPLAGELPDVALRVANTPSPTPWARVIAEHGEVDQVIPHERGVTAVATLQQRGLRAELWSEPNEGHGLDASMRARIVAQIDDALRSACMQ